MLDQEDFIVRFSQLPDPKDIGIGQLVREIVEFNIDVHTLNSKTYRSPKKSQLPQILKLYNERIGILYQELDNRLGNG